MIRQAIEADLFEIERLEKKIFNESLGFAFLKQELVDNPFSKIFVYEQDGKIIGYMSYRQIDSNADIMNFLVDEPYQNQGIGKEIFKFVLEEMKNDGCETIILEVRKSNQRAIYFYESFGGKVIRTIPNYYKDEDGLVMIIEVNKNDYTIS
ncbi:ribosomal protein S18-alanine N-acetyltransferase [Acholeplasma equirhinis]|uniref:ribosomal protein S18-alanine N-acetyltransferase n=1 Tax=Acholeplasma equirhinis TaxID=555393 RepID=UPI00197A7819|nr:ribosomal protein S18-alanine N-acetyltransferase [Acholeplasma equirhinis]MBN3490988.1 ribosomal protein S18-alanine N-acetyltransferase [Acholeplasma equirhinis]